MENYLKRGDESFITADYVSAIDYFTQAIQLARKNGASARVLFDILERRAVASEKAERFTNALSDAIRLTKILPDDPAGYLRWALLLAKKEEKYFEALEILLTAKEKVKCKPKNAVGGTLERWNRLCTIIDQRIEKLKLKTGYCRRQDPCIVFPFEILHDIFSHLNIKDWARLQIVSKSWHSFLKNDHYLWASSIDFSCLKQGKHNSKILKKCLNNAFLTTQSSFSPVKTVKHLRMGPFFNADIEGKCVDFLNRKSFPYPGKSIDSLTIDINNHHLLSITTSVNSFVSVRKLIIAATKTELSSGSPYYIDQIFSNNEGILEELDLTCRGVFASKSFDSFDSPSNYTNHPLIKSISLTTSFVMPVAWFTIFYSCPNLEHFLFSFSSSSFDFLWLLKLIHDSKLKTLTISRYGSSSELMQFKELNQPSKLDDTPPIWPKYITSLTLSKISWRDLKDVSGSLGGLTTLDLSHSSINIQEFFQLFRCGPNLEKLILVNVSTQVLTPLNDLSSIWENCFKLQQLSLFGIYNINTPHIKAIISHCPNLQQIDVGETSVPEEMIFRLARHGLKLIGCQSISFGIDSYKDLSRSGSVISWTQLKM